MNEHLDVNGPIRIGDIISLRYTKHGGYMSVEGILVEDVFLDPAPMSFDDCLFKVHLQQQYSAARELEEFVEQLPETSRQSDSEQRQSEMQQYLQALTKGKLNEEKLNQAYMKQRSGTPLRYGDTIQLLHMKSGKFLTVSDTQVAKQQRENLRSLVCEGGNQNSWLQLLPRYKINRDGDVIHNMSEVFLQIVMKPNEYIHCSDRAAAETRPEINCSFERTPWQLQTFQACNSESRDILSAGDAVLIFDPENRAFLKSNAARQMSTRGSLVSTPVYLESTTARGWPDSNCIWVLEREVASTGGPVCRSDLIRLRHLNSAWFLSIAEYEDRAALETTRTATDASLFELAPLQPTQPQLPNNAAIQIHRDGLFCCRTIHHGQVTLELTDDRHEAISVLIYRPPRDMLMAVHVGVNALTHLQSFIKLLYRQDWAAVAASFNFFLTITSMLERFVQGKRLSGKLVLDDQEDEHTLVKKQILFLEQGIVQSLVEILDFTQDARLHQPRARAMTDPHFIRTRHTLIQQTLQLLFSTMHGNNDVQLYLADSFEILLAHISTHPLAGRCIEHILRHSVDVHEQKLGRSQIDIFVQSIHRHPLEPVYLLLLQHVCSCLGRGIHNNQVDVAEAVVTGLATTMFNFQVDKARRKLVDWGDLTDYLPQNPGVFVHGRSLINKGLPSITVSWSTSDTEMSPLALFGKLSVSIFDINEALRSMRDEVVNESQDLLRAFRGELLQSALSSTRRRLSEASDERRLLVAEALLAQLHLAAEMSLDRNYVAIDWLSERLPCELLLNVAKSPVHDKLRAAAVKLIMCLYVDRDPQSVRVIPRLSWSWHDLSSGDAEMLISSPSYRTHAFALVQYMTVEHLRGMKGNSWSELSYQWMRLLLKLVQFHIFCTRSHLHDLMQPIVEVLDRRRVAVDVLEKRPQLQLRPSGSERYPYKRRTSTSSQIVPEQLTARTAPTSEPEPTSAPETETWLLDALDSLPALSVLMVIVVASAAVTIYQAIWPSSNPVLDILYSTITLIFVLELLVRATAYYRVHREIWSLCRNVYYQVDMGVILVEAALFVAEMASNSKGYEALRLIRIARVARVSRWIAKVSNTLVTRAHAKWVLPARFTQTSKTELATMVQLVRTLRLLYNIVQDAMLALLLKEFQASQAEDQTRLPHELLQDVMERAYEMTVPLPQNIEAILLDLIMYDDKALVQASLSLLMAHCSMASLLFHHARQVQLLTSALYEAQFRMIWDKLLLLKKHTETMGQWYFLKTEQDNTASRDTLQAIEEMITSITQRQKQLIDVDEFEANPAVQNMMRNAGVIAVIARIYATAADLARGPEPTSNENMRQLGTRASRLLELVAMNNPKNQRIVFDKLSLYKTCHLHGVNFGKILRSTLQSNVMLARLVPRAFVVEIFDRILTEGRKPEYLEMLCSLTGAHDTAQLDNQFEVMKALTDSEKAPLILALYDKPDSKEYRDRAQLMSPFVDSPDVLLEELPIELQYHLWLLRLLTVCSSGLNRAITVEAKVQSLYSFEDLLTAILDPRTALICKHHLVDLMTQAYLDVDTPVPGISTSYQMWKLLQRSLDQFHEIKSEMEDLNRSGWQHEGVSKRRLLYGFACAKVVWLFFRNYFDATAVRSERKHTSRNPPADDTESIPQIDEQIGTITEWEDLIRETFGALRVLYDMQSPYIPKTLFALLSNALLALREASDGKLKLDRQRRRLLGSFDLTDADAILQADYDRFLDSLESDPNVVEMIETSTYSILDHLKALPLLNANVSSDLRYEPFIGKLVSHVRDLVSGGDRAIVDEETSRTIIWVLNVFRRMIEREWGMTIDQRDGLGGEQQDEAAHIIQQTLTECGVSTVAIELISTSTDASVGFVAVKLLVAMLYREGGYPSLQMAMWKHLQQPHTDRFFQRLHEILHNLNEYFRLHDEFSQSAEGVTMVAESVRAIRMMQLMCEGHHKPNQEVFREQPHHTQSLNLLDDLVELLNTLSKSPSEQTPAAALAVSATILETLQGPCEKNQEYLALNTDLIEILNRVMRTKNSSGFSKVEELQLKRAAIDIFQALLEAQSAESAVYERVLSVIHLDILLMLCPPDEELLASLHRGGEIVVVEPEYEHAAKALRTECLVLLQMLCDYKPSIRSELLLTKTESIEELMGHDVGCVEVMWHGELQRRFFRIPSICAHLAEPSKQKLLEEVDRNNQEMKLQDFMSRAYDLYREMRHQQNLHVLGVDKIFSRRNQELSTWWSFLVACFINLLIVVYYQEDGDKVALPDHVRPIVDALNVINIVSSAFTFILFVVVRSPVKFEFHRKRGLHTALCLLHTISDPMTVYYCCYLIVAFLGLMVSDAFLSLLLLDIVVKNSTTRDLVYSVVFPFRQIMLTLLLGVFLVYIFSIALFFLYRDDFVEPATEDCVTTFDCLKASLSYGLRSDAGVAVLLSHTLGDRYILDLLYFMVINVTLMNMLMGIIVDTFSELRHQKRERLRDTTEKCFICGIEKRTFDKESADRQGFAVHIKKEHCMWNYIFYMVFIWEQDRDDDDGLEQYVRQCIELSDISWFPVDRALRLKGRPSETAMLTETMIVKLDQLIRMLGTQDDAHLMTHRLSEKAISLMQRILHRNSNALSESQAAGLRQRLRNIRARRQAVVATGS